MCCCCFYSLNLSALFYCRPCYTRVVKSVWSTALLCFSVPVQWCKTWSLLEHLCPWLCAVTSLCVCVLNALNCCLLSVHTDVSLLACLMQWNAHVSKSPSDKMSNYILLLWSFRLFYFILSWCDIKHINLQEINGRLICCIISHIKIGSIWTLLGWNL